MLARVWAFYLEAKTGARAPTKEGAHDFFRPCA
jgi:hypothetical protein